MEGTGTYVIRNIMVFIMPLSVLIKTHSGELVLLLLLYPAQVTPPQVPLYGRLAYAAEKPKGSKPIAG